MTGSPIAILEHAGQADQAGIVFYDGLCPLCTWSVRVLVKVDRHRRMMFAPLQGVTAQTVLSRIVDASAPARSLVFFSYRSGHIFLMSDALIEIACSLGGIWGGVRVLTLIPRAVRDSLYTAVARVRYRLFGKHDVCWIPEGNTRSQFLK